jgi:hypothetical protein
MLLVFIFTGLVVLLRSWGLLSVCLGLVLIFTGLPLPPMGLYLLYIYLAYHGPTFILSAV